MGDWAEIKIEFTPDMLDPDETVKFLTDFFRHPSGVPTAIITLVSAGGEPDSPPGIPTIFTHQGQPAGIQVDGVVQSPPFTPARIELVAEAVWAWHGGAAGGKKIQAIKDMRAITNLGLKEAKDAIDAAHQREVHP